MTKSIRSIVLALTCLTSLACGSGSSASCPELQGTWIIKEHCEPSQVNQAVMVTQDNCSISLAKPFDGFRGIVSADGSVSVVGTTPGGSVMSCEGTASSSRITMNCNSGQCAVTISR